MTRLRGLIAVIAAGAFWLGAPNAPANAALDVSGGTCALVELTLFTDANSNLKIVASGGTCVDVDNNWNDFHQVGSLGLSGLVSSCSTSPALVLEADLTFTPAGNSRYPTAIHLVLATAPGGATALTMKSAGLPPAFAGSGSLVFDGGDCSSASWSLGTLVYEDPTL